MGLVGGIISGDSGRKRRGTVPGKKKRTSGWAPKTVEHKFECMKKVVENDGHGVDENLTHQQLNSPQVSGALHQS